MVNAPTTPCLLRSSGTCPTPCSLHLPRARVGDVDAVDLDAAARGGRIPAMASTSSRWPLPSTPAMPKISPARTVEVEAGTVVEAAVVGDRQVADLRARAAPGCAGVLSIAKITSRPTMSVASALLRRRRRVGACRRRARGAAP